MATDGLVAKLRSGESVVDEDFQRPPFIHPYAVKINPLFLKNPSNFRAQTHEWLLQKNVNTVFNPEKFSIIVDMDIPGLAARVYPDAGERGLEYASKFLTMLFILDDLVDTTDVGKCTKATLVYLMEFHLVTLWSFPNDSFLRSQLVPFLSSLGDEEREQKLRDFESTLAEAKSQPCTIYPGELSVVSNVFRDTWADSVARMPPNACLRLAYALQVWLLGVLREAQIRKALSVPGSIDEYIRIRRMSSAMQSVQVLVDGVYGICTPDEWFSTPQMQRVLDATNDLVSWHNDLWSFKREVLVLKDLCNLVYVISIHSKVSYAAAAGITIDMLNDRVPDLEQALSDLEAITPPDLKANFTMYMRTSKWWTSGCHDWTATCSRYA